MQDGPQTVWSIPPVSVAFLSSLKQNFIAYRSSKVSDCIFEIHKLWQSGFSRVYSNFCCSCCFEPEIIEIGQSSHKVYSNNILNCQVSTTILNACTKKSGNLLKAPCSSIYYKSFACTQLNVFDYYHLTILNAHTKKVWKLIVCTSYIKHVLLKTAEYFLFRFLKWKLSSFLIIFLMLGSRWWRNYPILDPELSTISLVILRCCVRLFLAVSFYTYLESLFYLFCC